MSNPNDRQYTNGEITVYWKPSKCIHATTCFRELIEVYNPRNRPWVNMNGASTDEIIAVTNKCPTQAITWKYNKDIEDVPDVNQDPSTEINPATLHGVEEDKPRGKVTIMKNGPMLVEGEFEIEDGDGNQLKPMIMTSFCRCGNSNSQPFCDGTHRKVGFLDDVE